MRTLCLTMGLLLFSVCYCNAAPNAPATLEPGDCCFKFSMARIPKARIIDIVKTHSRCQEKAFVVHTKAGKKVCYSQNVDWVETMFDQEFK